MKELKVCSSCKVPKAPNEFNKNKGKWDGLTCYCKVCESIVRKTYKKNTLNKRKNKLKSQYNISVEEYSAMYNSQEGKCPICNRHQDELKVAMCVDHDHITGNVRGLLCTKCNLRLGTFNDKIEDLKAAIVYLEKYK
jgi:hypothetical protein